MLPAKIISSVYSRKILDMESRNPHIKFVSTNHGEYQWCLGALEFKSLRWRTCDMGVNITQYLGTSEVQMNSRQCPAQ